MGLPDSIYARYQIQGGGPTAPNYNIIFPYYGFYGNDLFRINPKFTLSAGLRYDLSIPDYTPHPQAAPCCVVYKPTTEGGILEYPGIALSVPIHYLSASKTDFTPG